MVSGAAVAAGAALAVAGATRLATLPSWSAEAALVLVVSGVIGLLLPAVLPAKLVEVHSTSGTPTPDGVSPSLAPGVRAHTGSEGTL